MGITISEPGSQKKVFLGESVDFVGRVALGTSRVELTADGEFDLPTVTLEKSRWFVSNRFNQPGTRRVVARAFDAVGNEIGTAEVEIVVTSPATLDNPVSPSLTALVPIPKGINQGVSRARQATMLQIFGRPCGLGADCTAVTNQKVRALLVTRDVGPFAVTGIRPAVAALERVFAAVKSDRPEVYKVLGTAGVLCCRRVRTGAGKPPSKSFSNHSWGTAIDLKIKGALDPVGDGRTQFGIALIAPHFHAERFYWGAGFAGDREDAMHFEASDELVREWQDRGLLD